MYVYSTQIYSLTKQTPLGFVFSCHPLELTILRTGSALPASGYVKASMQILWSRLEASICTLRANADANMASTHHRYKEDYNPQVPYRITVQPHDWICIKRSPFAATSVTDAAQTALSACDKYILHSLGLFAVKAGQPHPLFIDEHKIDIDVLTDRVTRAPHTERLEPGDKRSARQQNKEGHKNHP